VNSYESKLSILETEQAIKWLKDRFESLLSQTLALHRVSAPLFVERGSGLNDELSGQERPVAFDVEETELEIVHSLAKWKREAIARYGIQRNQGLYTDMDAIRKDETLSPLHSYYVDQWDWERTMAPSERNQAFLERIVQSLYQAFLTLDSEVASRYPPLQRKLPSTIPIVEAADLEKRWPQLTPETREAHIAKEKKAVFIKGIGWPLTEGAPHDERSPDYDDWSLNGDILFWHEPLGKAVEMSSMGIRVDADTLEMQLEAHGKQDRLSLPFHKRLHRGYLPQTVGGGIGQSRLALFFLEKVHIGEVQASYWPASIRRACRDRNIFLL